MAMERVPYLVGGGFEHSAEIMRVMLAAATSGAEGIMTPGDMKVNPLPVPGTSVVVAPGNALIRNSYSGGAGQTYATRAPEQTELPIVATGSAGGRTDLIVARIDDPTYGGGPFDPLTFEAAKFEVIRGVPANTKTTKGLGLNYPAIALARVTLPASTGTVTAGMITDLREVALPRKERHLYVYPLVQGDGIHRIVNKRDIGDWWPNPDTVTGWRIDVPEWAQRVRIIGQAGGVLIRRGSANAWGRVWARIGSIYDERGVNTQETSWDLDSGSAGNVRESWITGADRSVPANIRGEQGMYVGLRGRVISSDNDNSLPVLDSLSVVSIDVEFYETAV